MVGEWTHGTHSIIAVAIGDAVAAGWVPLSKGTIFVVLSRMIITIHPLHLEANQLPKNVVDLLLYRRYSFHFLTFDR